LSTNDTNHQECSTNSPGAILRRCREYHGISLEEAAEATKIGADHLTALERDQVKSFASLAYLKGFLRIYSTHLGLNPDDMVRLYEKLYAPPDQHGQALESGDGGVAKRRRVPWKKLVLPAVLLVLLLVISAIIERSRPSAPPAPQQAVLPPAAPQVAAPVQAMRSSARELPPPKETPPAAPAPAVVPKKQAPPPERPAVAPPQPSAAAKGFIVRMKVVHNGALAVTIDGAAAQSYELSVGDVIEWKAEKDITLELSNAGGVEIELNGKPLKPLGPEGQPAYVTLDAHGVKS
jgi:cytoskeleton protein RodZ